MSRWIKDVFLIKNFVDFLQRNCRAASTSEVRGMCVNIAEIISRGCRKSHKNFIYIVTKLSESMRQIIKILTVFVVFKHSDNIDNICVGRH